MCMQSLHKRCDKKQITREQVLKLETAVYRLQELGGKGLFVT